MDEEDVKYRDRHRYTQNGILLSHKKEENFANCSNMGELRGHDAK